MDFYIKGPDDNFVKLTSAALKTKKREDENNKLAFEQMSSPSALQLEEIQITEVYRMTPQDNEALRKQEITLLNNNINNINVHDLVKKSGNSHLSAEQKSDINTEKSLPIIQEGYQELKDLIIEKNPNHERFLNEIGNSLDDVYYKSEKEKLIKPMNKLGRFLKRLGDENSEYNKIISGSQKGIETAQKVGKTYNKFAQFLALPTIPDVFL